MDWRYWQSYLKSLGIVEKVYNDAANHKDTGDDVWNTLECHFSQYFNFLPFLDEAQDLPFAVKMHSANAAQQIKQVTSLDTFV